MPEIVTANRLVDGIVVGYGGTVDKHIGDAVMALFGAPRAHDDDPMRSARACPPRIDRPSADWR